MTYNTDIADKAYKIFKKLSRKDRKQLEIINKKILEIKEILTITSL